MINSFPTFGWVVHCFFPQATNLLILPKIGCPVNFLVVSDDRTTANFEHCTPIVTKSTIKEYQKAKYAGGTGQNRKA